LDKAKATFMLRADTIALTALLALLTAFGPISTDMYVPSMPEIGRYFTADASRVQLTLSGYLGGFAVGQIVYGPMADRLGRKPVLLLALALFCVASLACAVAPNIEILIAARALQAFGAAGVVTLPRAIVRDLHSGERAANELSRVGAIMSLAPVIAPLIGGVVQVWFGWRVNFLVITATGIVATAFVWFALPETLQRRSSEPMSLAVVWTRYRMLLSDRLFRAHLGVAACSFAGLFAWISGSAFVLQGHYGLSAFQFAVVYAVACLGSLVGGMISAPVVMRLGLTRTIGAGSAILAAGGIAMATALAMGAPPVEALALTMFVYHTGMMLAMPAAIAGAVTPYPEVAGAACSLVGFAQQVAAALVGAVVGYALGNSAWPLAIALIAMGALSIACWLRIRTTEAIAHAAETLRPMAIKNRAKPADL
jgi:DHA1 family bicyclomycin/chloramphenicol resistance-like MFS transporter